MSAGEPYMDTHVDTTAKINNSLVKWSPGADCRPLSRLKTFCRCD